MSPFILSHTTAQEALTIIHLNTQLTAPAGEQLTVPSLPLPLSVPDTSLLSSRPLTPAPSPSFSLFPSVSSLALPLSDKMHTSPYSLSSLFFFFDISPHPLTRSAPWKQISVGGTIRCAFPHAIYKLILVWWTISKDIFSRNKTKPVMKG